MRMRGELLLLERAVVDVGRTVGVEIGGVAKRVAPKGLPSSRVGGWASGRVPPKGTSPPQAYGLRLAFGGLIHIHITPPPAPSYPVDVPGRCAIAPPIRSPPPPPILSSTCSRLTAAPEVRARLVVGLFSFVSFPSIGDFAAVGEVAEGKGTGTVPVMLACRDISSRSVQVLLYQEAEMSVWMRRGGIDCRTAGEVSVEVLPAEVEKSRLCDAELVRRLVPFASETLRAPQLPLLARIRIPHRNPAPGVVPPANHPPVQPFACSRSIPPRRVFRNKQMR